jgi:nucleotide-binding universal stress UspA family protein
VYRRVLVPLDGSLVAEGVIPFIMEIAGPLDMQVVLLRVLVPVPPMPVEGTRQVVIEDLEKRRAEAEEYLVGMARELRDKGVRVTTDVRRGEPVAEILQGAREAEADLIAMTTHGRSGLRRLLFGSVAEAVLRQAEIPVFLMRLANDQAAARAAWQGEKPRET